MIWILKTQNLRHFATTKQACQLPAQSRGFSTPSKYIQTHVILPYFNLLTRVTNSVSVASVWWSQSKTFIIIYLKFKFNWVSCILSRSPQFSSVVQSCPTLCDPMNRSMPGLPVHHHLLEFTQTHVHRVSDAIQPSHPLSRSPSY